MEMTLSEAVHLALRHNRNLKSAYLNRVLERFNLRQQMTKFHPDIEVNLRAETQVTEDSTTYREGELTDHRETTQRSGASVVTGISQKIPTGAEMTFVWDNSVHARRTSHRTDTIRSEPYDSAWGIELSQPLLKGGGLNYNTASIIRARLREEEAVRNMRDRVIGTVTEVISDYRQLLRAYQDLRVQRESLEKAREQMAVTQALISAGRRAANEIIQSETSIARHELSVEEAKSRLDDAQLKLLNTLNIGRNITIVPTEEIEYRYVKPDYDECLEIAFNRDARYLAAINRIETSKLEIMEAKNQRLWDLSFDAGYRKGWHKRRYDYDYHDERWDVGLSVRIPLPIYGDAKYAREMPLLNARISSRNAQMDILTVEENLENEVRNAVRSVESAHKQVELARRTLELSERSFEVSELQFRMGRISNNDFIRDQDSLRNDQLAMINAIISYENTLTRLDRILATTLDTWEIDFVPQRSELEEELLGRKTWMLGGTDN